jgi:hypothetical protein
MSDLQSFRALIAKFQNRLSSNDRHRLLVG